MLQLRGKPHCQLLWLQEVEKEKEAAAKCAQGERSQVDGVCTVLTPPKKKNSIEAFSRTGETGLRLEPFGLRRPRRQGSVCQGNHLQYVRHTRTEAGGGRPAQTSLSRGVGCVSSTAPLQAHRLISPSQPQSLLSEGRPISSTTFPPRPAYSCHAVGSPPTIPSQQARPPASSP
jgi:hypothetical protein